MYVTVLHSEHEGVGLDGWPKYQYVVEIAPARLRIQTVEYIVDFNAGHRFRNFGGLTVLSAPQACA